MLHFHQNDKVVFQVSKFVLGIIQEVGKCSALRWCYLSRVRNFNNNSLLYRLTFMSPLCVYIPAIVDCAAKSQPNDPSAFKLAKFTDTSDFELISIAFAAWPDE